MIQRSLAALAAVAALAGPAAAQEGGVIRSGEHADFSRIVLIVDPTTEWSLELGHRSATISFPGRRIPFSTEGVFERMPKTRITAVETRTGEASSAVTVSLACDCRVSTAFVGARYLALDVADRGAPARPRAAAAPGDLGTGAQPADEALAAPDPAAIARRVDDALASAERILVDQLERAATQGLIELADPEAAADAGAAATAALPTPPASASPAPAEAPLPVATPPATPPLARPAAAPASDAEPAYGSDEERLLAHLATRLTAAHEQVAATTVFDRDSAAAGAARAAAAEAPPPACRDDDALDVGRWSDGRPLIDQAVERQARLVGEFDRPDAEAVRDLARLYVRHGLGAEAGAVLRGFGVALEEGPLLADLARVIESRPVAPGGPLSLGVACPGRHGLWLAVAGAGGQLGAEDRFASLRAAFEDMPPDLRALVGPDLVANYLDSGRGAEARIVHDIAIRSGGANGPAMELASGRLAAHENRPVEAEVRLAGLVAANAPNAPDALLHLVRARLDQQGRVPSAWITDLETLSIEHRGGAREAAARALIAEALARNGALARAFDALAALAKDIPATAPDVAALAPRLLAAADPAEVGAASYAAVVLAHATMIPIAPAHDSARIVVADRLLDLGLARPALAMLAPPVDREVRPARLRAARAYVALGEPGRALALIEDDTSPEAATIRARALAARGDFAAASAALGGTAEALPYAWVAGEWATAAGIENPALAAMARFMRDRAEAPPAELPAPLSPEAAFSLPILRPAEPSLAGSRRLIDSGRAVEDFVETLLLANENPTP